MCLFKPRIWSHSLAKIVCKLQLSGLVLVGLRVLTQDNRNATSLLPAESVTEWLSDWQIIFNAKPTPRLFIQCCVQDPSDLEAYVARLCSGSSLALCLEGENAARRLLDVLRQEDSSLCTGCYGKAHSYNGICCQCPVLHAGTQEQHCCVLIQLILL